MKSKPVCSDPENTEETPMNITVLDNSRFPASVEFPLLRAAKYGWQATGVKLNSGQSFDYAAKDTWKLQSGGDGLTADGDANGQGRLAGIIMKDFSLGEPFDLGIRGTCQAPQEGDLYLRCRDGWNQIGDNDGTITVHLRKSSVP